MTEQDIIPSPADAQPPRTITQESIESALKACESDRTRGNYEYSLQQFAGWLKDREIGYDSLLDYRAYLVRAKGGKGKKLTAQSINLRLAAIRFYLKEMANKGQLPKDQVQAALMVKTLKVRGRKLGNWLPLDKANELLAAPDISTPAGLRDRAVLGLMIGAGLRRSEIVSLKVEHFEEREGSWVIKDIIGKGNKTRTVPIAGWVKVLVDAWTIRAGIKTGYIVRACSWAQEGFWLRDTPMDATALYYQVQKKYGKGIGIHRLAPHDLRRTSARLAYEGDVPMGQIQLMLGHTSQVITERYIAVQQTLTTAPSDKMGIEVKI